jgi:hypothetical protein
MTVLKSLLLLISVVLSSCNLGEHQAEFHINQFELTQAKLVCQKQGGLHWLELTVGPDPKVEAACKDGLLKKIACQSCPQSSAKPHTYFLTKAQLEDAAVVCGKKQLLWVRFALRPEPSTWVICQGLSPVRLKPKR